MTQIQRRFPWIFPRHRRRQLKEKRHKIVMRVAPPFTKSPPPPPSVTGWYSLNGDGARGKSLHMRSARHFTNSPHFGESGDGDLLVLGPGLIVFTASVTRHLDHISVYFIMRVRILSHARSSETTAAGRSGFCPTTSATVVNVG